MDSEDGPTEDPLEFRALFLQHANRCENEKLSAHQRRFFSMLNCIQSGGLFSCRGDGVSVTIFANEQSAVYVSMIKTTRPCREKGRASDLLRRLCDTADATGIELVLKVEPKGDIGLDSDQLGAWYRRFDFVGEGGELARPPKGLS